MEEGKGRLYPAYSVSGSESEECPSPARRFGSQHTYQHPLYQQPQGLSDTPTSENASDATLTDSELALARDSTLLVHNGKWCTPYSTYQIAADNSDKGCLLDSASRPPDVPPRNPTMNRLNGRLAVAQPSAPSEEFEPSCLVRTPSGNVYIPSNHSKAPSTLDYKSNSSCSSPSKEMKNSDRCGLAYGTAVPVLPVRNNLRRPNSSHFPPASRFHFQKGIASKCSWKCTAIVFIVLSVVLTAALSYISASSLLSWSYQNSKACTVVVGENSETAPASKATTSETNLSTSSKPRVSSGGNNVDAAFVRKRRQVDSVPHVSVNSTASISNNLSTSLDVAEKSNEHAVYGEFSSHPPLHDINVSRISFLPEDSRRVTNIFPSGTPENSSSVFLPNKLVKSFTISSTNDPLSYTNEDTDKFSNPSTAVDTDSLSTTYSYISTEGNYFKETENTYSSDDLETALLSTDEPRTTDVYHAEDKNSNEQEIIMVDKDSSSLEETEEENDIKSEDEDKNKSYEGPDIQHDFPSKLEYIDIIDVNEQPISTTSKTKIVYNITENLNITKDEQRGSEETSKELTEQNLSVKNNIFEKSLKGLDITSGKVTSNLTNSTQIAADLLDQRLLNLSNASFASELPTTKPFFEKSATEHPKNETKFSSSLGNIELNSDIQSKGNENEISRSNDVPHMTITGAIPAKRVLVNVTISTDPDSVNPNPNSVYVLSVSVPTNGDNEPPSVNILPHASSQEQLQPAALIRPSNNKETEPSPVPSHDTSLVHGFWGGQCQCSCPCLDDPKNYTDYDSDYDDKDGGDALQTQNVKSSSKNTYIVTPNVTETSSETPSELSSSDSTTSSWTTETMQECLESSTKLPPPPTILVLEGARTFPAQSFPPDGTTFSQISLGQRLSKEIPPYGYWNMQFYQSEAAYVKFDYNIPRGASIGVYARRNALPTHTQYHILEVLNGFKARTARASHPSVRKEVTHYMEQGHWFLSLYNDDGDPQEVVFVANVADDMTHNCPNGCSGKGECLMGHCQCNPGFGGDDCSESVCPVLCSQRGDYINGECQCNPGWKGKECSLRHDECEVPDCNGHGHCVNGKCNCVRGYKGNFCEEVDCPHPNCSGHGFCIEGTCFCKKGWKGNDCSETDKEALQCLPDCSGHGTFDLETQTCTCEERWSGDDCSKELCDLDCGSHGRCISDTCHCSPGWTGEYCNLKECDTRCNDHGQCKNGTCLCVTGWNGKHCTLEGCPNSCSNHGQCKYNSEGSWECRCENGWDGEDCSVLLERDCDDGRDNDKDGLVDCEDPECCTSYTCRTSQLCVSSPKPIDILLRKQPPAITASFFERMKFLIDEGSLQNYAKEETFNESRSAVVRGRVLTQMGMGLMGVRVSTTTPLEGFTLTRDDGWFDLLVNGGGAVTLNFGRAPFQPKQHIVFVPWNEVVIIDDIVMVTNEDANTSPVPQACIAHNYDTMKPVVLATWKHGFQGACPDRSAILAESQVVQESLQIPGTGLNLVYQSSRAAGYLSTIQLQLTPENIPSTLKLIHLRITIEGILFEKTFEADPGIKFTYAWNRLNVYRQRVYGVTTAMIKVGYEYTDCKDIIWDVQSTKLSGHDMSISDVGGWNLDIHHRYNFHEGILQKGDGSNIYLKHKPRVIITTVGDGHQRPLDCNDCDGPALKQRLLAPVSLVSAPDGSIFIGDFNLIRKIQTDGTVHTVVKLNATRVSYRYHMALSPLDGVLYVSDPESHQILKVRNTNDYSNPEHNWEIAVGSGERCLPGDEAHCGDGALARDAKLAYPKGVAVSANNVLYFADGTNIRMVDNGVITTVIGNHMHKSHWKPIPCEGTLNLEEVHLRWPTELAINPLDNSLYIIDDHMILQLAPDGRIKVVAGRPLHCAPPVLEFDIELATHATLVMPQSIAFSANGDLYVAESDSQRINRIRVIGTDGKVALYAGAESKCNCLERGCDCFEADHYLAANSKFNTISSVTVSPDGIVHIADQANYRIRSVMASIPDASSSREYEIFSPETQEIYIFNRFGQHVMTKNILTRETNYLFTYNVNTSNGKLSTVTDAAGNKVFLLRDYSSQVNSIENTKGQKCRLRMSRMRMLQELNTPDNYNVTFDYHGPTGLLKTKLDSSGRSYVYSYDEFGRLTFAVTPTGKIIRLSFDLSLKGAMVMVRQNNKQPISMLIKGSSVVTKIGESEHKSILLADGSVTSIAPWSHSTSTDTVPYSILAEINPLLGESCPVPAKQRTEIGGELANRFEWRYFLRRLQVTKGKISTTSKTITHVGRKLRVNGENLLTMEYDREQKSVSVFMDDRVELLNVTYDHSSRPIKWGPSNGIFADVELEYDRFSRLTSWKWGDLSETYGFDRAGRLYEIKYADGSSMVYAFKDMFSTLPLKVTTPRGSDYLLQYDEAGALQSLTTPRGHIHTFALQTSFGFFKYQYYSPMTRHPFEIIYNDDGQILAKVYPHQSGRVAYVYDYAGKLETILGGLHSIHYTYHDSSSLVKSIEIIESNFQLKQEFKYHLGIVKEEKVKFLGKNSLDNAKYKYQYDGNARLSTIEVDIAGKQMPQLLLKYNQNFGVLEAVSDLRIYRNTFNRSVMQDKSKQFFMITDFDNHGRIKSLLMNIKTFDVFRLKLDYDTRNRIKTQELLVGRTTSNDRIEYNADGHVLEIAGTNNWKYVYDENGNVIGVIREKDKISLGYDSGDRVVQYGDVEFNSYDNRGFVVRRGEQKYRYNSHGQLIHAFERDKFQIWYHYDDRGRLISWNDDKENVTQYFYANPSRPNLVTHLHFPKSGRTFRFLYDQHDTIITVETSEQRFYVAADQNGSPLALFDINGNLIKEIRRTPFGSTIMDTNPDFYLPVDFHGGILDPNTKLIYLNKRLYDPIVGQWMTPVWEKLATKLFTPTDIFVYRFENNDPINSNVRVPYMTDLNSWLKLYGYSVKNMMGLEYIKSNVYQPKATITSPQLAPDFGVMSGLECIVEKINEKFSDLGFVPKPLLKMEPKTRNLLPRVAYRKSVFGEGVLISRVEGRTLVSVVDGVNRVVQDVVTSVFNNSFFLNLHFTIHDQDVFYFVKDNVLKIRDDLEELRRLGGMFNVSTHEITDHGTPAGKELRLHNPDAVVIVKYGVDPEQETHKILKHAHKRAVERAWEMEKQLVAAGFQGRGDWTEEEKEELISHGDIDGYEGVDIHSIHKYPQLADDPGNIVFQRDTKRKRRKSGMKRGRFHRHDS
ncbi:teneurin-m isoform X2 [Agrilus planipennis]|uniref:Tenascin-like protein n=1 Tax=Agrilus planipennis TaxID=224129 RepID=A0A7F5R6F2_AGRPL|nr:teneurin-m isoform X2 [Agrilus planipennis]